MAMKRAVVTAVSDVACPWCHLGKAFLDDAIKALEAKGISVEINWRTYRLDPAIRSDGEELQEYVVRKFGVAAAGDGGVMGRLRQMAKLSSSVRFANWVRIPNTLNAHRVVHAVRNISGWKLAHECIGRIFEAAYEEGKNVSALAQVLAAVKGVPGINVQSLEAALSGDAFVREVEDEDRRSKTELRVEGVPCFLVEVGGRNGRLVGCNRVDEWVAFVDGLLQ